jgi:hypothetical protein
MICNATPHEPPYAIADYLTDTGIVAARSVNPEMKDEEKI